MKSGTDRKDIIKPNDSVGEIECAKIEPLFDAHSGRVLRITVCRNSLRQLAQNATGPLVISGYFEGYASKSPIASSLPTSRMWEAVAESAVFRFWIADRRREFATVRA
jgi:hypothetical protein